MKKNIKHVVFIILITILSIISIFLVISKWDIFIRIGLSIFMSFYLIPLISRNTVDCWFGDGE